MSKEDSSSSSSSSSFSSSAHQSSLPPLILVLVSTLLGAGVLGVSHAFASAGYLLGLLLLLFSACFSSFGLYLLSECARALAASRQKSTETTTTRRTRRAEEGEEEEEKQVASAKPLAEEEEGAEEEGAAAEEEISFHSIAHLAAPSLTKLIDAAVALKCFGVALSYLIIIGDVLPPAFATSFDLNSSSSSAADESWLITALRDRRVWITIVFCCLAAPLSFLPSLKALRFTSAFSLCFVLCLTAIVACYKFDASQGNFFDPCADFKSSSSSSSASESDCKGETNLFAVNLQTLLSLPTFVFAFTCAQNIPSVYQELSSPTRTRVKLVIGAPILIGLFVYLSLSLCAYATYGSNVASNLLLSYPNTHFLSLIRILVAINLSFTFPLQMNPTRKATLNLIMEPRVSLICWPKKNDNEEERVEEENMAAASKSNGFSSSSSSSLSQHLLNGDTKDGLQYGTTGDSKPSSSSSLQEVQAHNKDHIAATSASNVSNTTYILVTSLLCLSCFTISILVHDLGIVLSIVGASGSATISYILPGLCYVKIHESEGWTSTRIGALALALFGLILMPTCLIAIAFGASH